MAPKAEEKKTAATTGEGADAKAEGKGKGKGKLTRKNSALTKARALAQIISLTPDDDEREATSKKISWILRKGAARVGINADGAGWVKFEDLYNCDLLDDVPDKSEEKIMSVIDESNEQKLRYELKDSDGGKLIRALKKEERKSRSGDAPGEKAGDKLKVVSESKLNGEAPAFIPGQAVAGNSPTAMHPQMGYPGFGFSPFGFQWPYSPYGYAGYGAAAQPAAAAAAAAAATQDSGSKRFQGRIKSFNTEKGYGFIESLESYQDYGRDVFLHKAHLGDFAVGTFVSFAVEMNKSGMPQGRDLAASDGSGAKGKGKGKGKGKKGDGKADGKGDQKEKGKGAGKKDKKEKGDDKKEKEDAEKGEATAVDPGPVNKEAEAAPAADADKS